MLLPPGSTRTYSLCPYPPLFRSGRMADQYENASAYGPADAQRDGAAQAQGAAQLRPGPPGFLTRRGDGHHRLADLRVAAHRSEEHTSELQSLMRISYADFCLKKKTHTRPNTNTAYYSQYQK